MTADRIIYFDEPEARVLDLRPDGVDCIPVLGFTDRRSIHHAVEMHYHPGCMEFCLCIKSNTSFVTPEREYPYRPGHIFVSSPSQPHHLRANPRGLKHYWLLFEIPRPGRRTLGLDARGSEWLARSLTHLPMRLFASTPEVKSAFERLIDIYDHARRRSPARRVKMRSAALALLVALIDAARQKPDALSEKMTEIAGRIRDRPDADYSAAALAAECGLPATTFARNFKRAVGLPLHAHLLSCRIGRARELLLKSKRTVEAIGHELRFCSTQHFARTFKRIVGVNPQAYRARNGSVLLVPRKAGPLHRAQDRLV